MRDPAEAQKWILKPGIGGDMYKKDVEGVSAANDTLERLVLP